jgi:hypothetical protein
MKAKYCPCLGVKFSAAGRGDIGEDYQKFEVMRSIPNFSIALL